MTGKEEDKIFWMGDQEEKRTSSISFSRIRFLQSFPTRDLFQCVLEIENDETLKPRALAYLLLIQQKKAEI